MYDVFAETSTKIKREFEDLLESLSEKDQKKLMTTLAKAPKSTPRDTATSNLYGRVEKKGKFWQYYAPDGYRVLYDVKDRPKQVIIRFTGNHNDAQIFLRRNN